jgi:hypothetical protein|tara:strand:+ start:449 stop:559 length:111 start_codon:yes stop_codon:yes gene_type:complete
MEVEAGMTTLPDRMINIDGGKTQVGTKEAFLSANGN